MVSSVLFSSKMIGAISMDKKERQKDHQSTDTTHETDEAQANPKVIKTGEKLKEDIDDLVDEIDQVLEENAEEFVKNYVQKGGQ
ncbi:MAG: ubiquitin-like protein Pup [Nitrospirales bacterium]